MVGIVKDASKRVTLKYGNGHTGVDIGWRTNENENIVYAHSDGVVVGVIKGRKKDNNTKGSDTYGNYVKIKHSSGFYTLYAHLSSVYVKVGDKVNSSTKIGVIGDSGNTFGRHLHFEVRDRNNNWIDPTLYLTKDFTQIITYQSYDLVKKMWLPNVKTNTNDYAGNFGNAMSGLYLDNLECRVHDKVKNEWLPWVKNRNDYAGNLGNAIDGIQIKNATYRVHLKNGSWLPWVNKVDNSSSGYAGIYGRAIDAIQIK